MNAIHIITPYKYMDVWVFDDATRGLIREPFVDELTKNVKNADTGFILLFSSKSFPEHNAKLVWDGKDMNGNWYLCNGMRGWLCPALLKFFKKAPKTIYVRIQ